MSDQSEPDPKPSEMPPEPAQPAGWPAPVGLVPLVVPQTARPPYRTFGFWYVMAAGLLSLFAVTAAFIIFMATPAATNDASDFEKVQGSGVTGSVTPSQSPSPGPTTLPQSVTQAIRKHIAEQSQITDDLTVDCPAWTPSAADQKVTCTVTHAGLQISVDLIVHGERAMRYDIEQAQAFLSGDAVRKEFETKYVDDKSDVRGHSCDANMPANAVVEFRKRLPYTCSVKYSFGTMRYAVRVSYSGLDFDSL